MKRGEELRITIVICNSPNKFHSAQMKKIQKESPIVCYELQYPSRPHTMNNNLTAKQRDKR